jgi:hypothetical protein
MMTSSAPSAQGKEQRTCQGYEGTTANQANNMRTIGVTRGAFKTRKIVSIVPSAELLFSIAE